MQRTGCVAYHQEQVQRQRVYKPDLQGAQQQLYKDFKEGVYHPLTFSEPKPHSPGQTLNS